MFKLLVFVIKTKVILKSVRSLTRRKKKDHINYTWGETFFDQIVELCACLMRSWAWSHIVAIPWDEKKRQWLFLAASRVNHQQNVETSEVCTSLKTIF